MIVGDSSQFAVEFELDKEYGGTWLFGKFCFWINKKCIGDYEMGTSLRDILFQLKHLVRDNGNRSNEELFRLSKEELYNRLNCVLYGYEPSEFEEKALEETWARFNITLPVDIFDGWKLFIVENKVKTRIVAKQIDDDDIFEFTLVLKEFDNVINSVYQELNNLYQLEMEKENFEQQTDSVI